MKRKERSRFVWFLKNFSLRLKWSAGNQECTAHKNISRVTLQRLAVECLIETLVKHKHDKITGSVTGKLIFRCLEKKQDIYLWKQPKDSKLYLTGDLCSMFFLKVIICTRVSQTCNEGSLQKHEQYPVIGHTFS